MPVYQGDGPPRVDEDFPKLSDNKVKKNQRVATTPSTKPRKGFDIDDLIFKGSKESSKR